LNAIILCNFDPLKSLRYLGESLGHLQMDDVTTQETSSIKLL